MLYNCCEHWFLLVSGLVCKLILPDLQCSSYFGETKVEDNVFPLTWFSLDQAPTTKSDIVDLAYLFIETQSSTSKSKSQKVQLNQNLGNINIRAAWGLDRFGTELPVAIHHTNIHSRMNSQKSCFTVHGKIKKSLADLVDSRVLRRYIIAPCYENRFSSFTVKSRFMVR